LVQSFLTRHLLGRISNWELAAFANSFSFEDLYSGLERQVTKIPQIAIAGTSQAWGCHSSKDMIVVIERTGRYHRPIQHAFAKAGFEVRVLHPYATKQYRQPADPGNKTDDTDLSKPASRAWLND
jgi:hypothetical protein